MSNNRITQAIPATALMEATQKLNDLKTLLTPYLQSLTVTERHDLLKMSNKSYSFVAKTAEYCSSNPVFIPAFMEAGELNLEFTTVVALRPLLELCKQLYDSLDDTMMLSGSEAFASSLLYYNNVKLAAKTGEPDAKQIYEDLSARFPGRPKKVTDADTATPAG